MSKLPITTRKPERFAPPGYDDAETKPVILLKIPRLSDKHEFQAAMIEAGIARPPDEAFDAELAAMLEAIEDDEIRAERMNPLDLVRAWRLARAEGEEPQDLDAETWEAYAALERVAADNWPPYRKLLAQRDRWSNRTPYLLLGMFAVGWEGYDVKFRRGADGRVDEDALERLPGRDVTQAALRLLQLFSPGAADLPNSARPSRSPSESEISTASASSHPTAAPDGISPAAASPEIPASS